MPILNRSLDALPPPRLVRTQWGVEDSSELIWRRVFKVDGWEEASFRRYKDGTILEAEIGGGSNIGFERLEVHFAKQTESLQEARGAITALMLASWQISD